MVLMSTLSTAADVIQAMTERRQGRDPASQEEPEIARRFLDAACEDLEDLLVSLRAAHALRVDEAAGAVVLARHVNELMLLNQASRLLHLIHQRLLSLYPSVTEELVETARLLERECGALRDGVSGSVGIFVDRAHDLTTAVQASL